MKNPHDLPEELFDMIAKSSFINLDADAKSFALSYISKEVYDEMHEALSIYKESDDALMEAISLQEDVVKRNRFRELMQLQVPLYKVAAMFILCFGLITIYIKQTEDQSLAVIQYQKAEKMENVSVQEGYYPESLVFEL